MRTRMSRETLSTRSGFDFTALQDFKYIGFPPFSRVLSLTDDSFSIFGASICCLV